MKNDDKNLQKAINDLPSHEPKDDLWDNIESALNQQQQGKVAKDTAPKPVSLLPFLMAKAGKGAKFAMAASVLLAVVGGYWLWNSNQNSTDKELLADIQKVSDIKPVFSNTDVAFKHLVVEAEKGAEFRMPNGTVINIPQDVFVDKNNNKIVGKVDLEYREFHNGAEILASGIPMVYDSAGIKQQFESAGMFELRGFKHDEPVFLAAGKSIKVDMASFAVGNDYRFYYLDQTNTTNVAYNSPLFVSAKAQSIENQFDSKNDTSDYAAISGRSKGVWKYLGIENPKPNTAKVAKIDSAVQAFSQEYQAKIEAEKKAIEAEKTTEENSYVLQRKSNRAIKAENFFKLSFDTQRYPELRPFEEMVWEYTGERDENRNPKSAKNYWVKDRLWRHIEFTKQLFVPVTLTGHHGTVNDAEFSPNGKFLATAAGGSAKIWDKNGKHLFDLDEHNGVVTQVDFSHDSKHILTVARGAVYLWGIDGKQMQMLGYNPDVVAGASFSADSKHIIAFFGKKLSSFDESTLNKTIDLSQLKNVGRVKVWDLAGNVVSDIDMQDGKDHNLENVVSLPKTKQEGAYKIVINKENINILKNNEVVKIIKGHQNIVSTAKFSEDGKFLVTGSNDRIVKVWDVEKGFELVSNLRVHKEAVEFVAVSPDNNAVLSIGKQNRLDLTPANGVAYLWRKISPKEADVYELAVYTKAETKEERKLFGDNVNFYTTIYQEKQDSSYSTQKSSPMLANRVKSLNEAIANYQQALVARRQTEELRLANEANLLRSYEVRQLGIYNWDRPFESSEIAFNPRFAIDESISHKVSYHNKIKAYMITGENGTVVMACDFDKINGSFRGQIRCSRFYPTTFVAVLPNNEITIFSYQDFKALKILEREDRYYNITFKDAKPISSIADLKEYLKTNG